MQFATSTETAKVMHTLLAFADDAIEEALEKAPSPERAAELERAYADYIAVKHAVGFAQALAECGALNP